MDKQDFDIWAGKLLKAWADLDPEGALSTLSKEVEYYESPFLPPCDSWERVKSLWHVIPDNQKDISYKYNVIMAEDNLGLIHFNVKRTTVPANKKQNIDGVFLVRLNDGGKCTMFKQWRMVKE